MNLDIANYFTSPTGFCSYTQCSIVDNLGGSINWITGGTLSGNKCSFNIDTSVLKPQTDFYIKLSSTTANPTTVTSNIITD